MYLIQSIFSYKEVCGQKNSYAPGFSLATGSVGILFVALLESLNHVKVFHLVLIQTVVLQRTAERCWQVSL